MSYLANLLAEADRIVDTVTISEPMFERLVTTHGLTVEANRTHKFAQWRGLTLTAPLAELS